EMTAFYLAADVMLVTPLRDGMNLVAKEYAACRTDDSGALVLSEFAGAADQLTQAVLINPHDITELKDAKSNPKAQKSSAGRSTNFRLNSTTCGL
ncbi:trehalose-6-phosphate synthase, partial [Brevibacterium paucivorans]